LDREVSRFERFGQPEVEVQPVRPADTLLVQLLDRLPGGAAHHLAGERSDHPGVVAVGTARTPERTLPGQPLGEEAIVGQLFDSEAAWHTDHAGPVCQQLAQCQPVLALGGELRPILGHSAVEIQHTVLHQQRHDQVSSTLGRGVQGKE
jgi:hypothetical protein